jgi:membrane-bound ClpP family serine protease
LRPAGLEVFVIPGFGMAGIGGIAAMLAGLSLGLVGHGATVRAIVGAAGRVTFSMLAAIAVSLVLFRFRASTPWAAPRARGRAPAGRGRRAGTGRSPAACSDGRARPSRRCARRGSPSSMASAWTWCRSAR